MVLTARRHVDTVCMMTRVILKQALVHVVVRLDGKTTSAKQASRRLYTYLMNSFLNSSVIKERVHY